MNNKKSIIMSVALAATMLATSISAFAYTDVASDHWANSYINDLSGKKYVSGYEDGTYKPDNYVTRAEFAKILTNIFGNIDKSGVELADVADSAWYADTMKIAVKAGYVTGYSDGTVKPEDNITRQEAAVMVYRAWELSPEGEANFVDAAQIGDWAKNQVATLAAKNVINGYTDGTFKPNNYITRAEVAKIISSAIELGIDKVSTPTTSGTSGVLHVGAASSATTHVSSSGNGGGGGGSGSSTGVNKGEDDNKKPATPPTAEAGEEQVITETVDTSDIVEDLEKADADKKVSIELSAMSSLEDIILVSVDGYDEMTITEFNETFAEDEMSTEDAAAILENLSFTVTEEAGVASVSIDVKVTDEDGEVVTEDTFTVDSNFVVASLKDFQNGEADNNDLTVVINNLTKGFTDSEKDAEDWIEDNERKIPLYSSVLSDVADVFADAEITSDNYKEYTGYFTKMVDIIDDTVEFVVKQDGELTYDIALDYFNDTVAKAIDEEVDEEYADDVKAVAKSFALDLASLIDEVNEAVEGSSIKNDQIKLVWDVYNKNYAD